MTLDTYTCRCDYLWKSIIMALEKPWKLRVFFSSTLWPPCLTQKQMVVVVVSAV